MLATLSSLQALALLNRPASGSLTVRSSNDSQIHPPFVVPLPAPLVATDARAIRYSSSDARHLECSALKQPANRAVADSLRATSGHHSRRESQRQPRAYCWLEHYHHSSTSTQVLLPSVITRSQVALYVYNFVLKKTPHFKTAMFGLPTRCPPPPGCTTIDQLDPWKQVYLEHRLTPNYPAWPNGLSTSTRIGMSARLTCARFRCRRVVV